MTDSKKKAIEDFLRTDKRNLATAMAIYETWPELAPKIKEEFMVLVWKLLKQELPEGMDGGLKPVYLEGGWNYICFRREYWQSYDAEKPLTLLYMEDQRGTNWRIGVVSPPPSSVPKDHRERRDRLQEKLGELGKKQSPRWPCWEWVDGKYRNWNPLIPQMVEELREGGGEITDYFVGKFKEVADQAIPIIDSIDGAAHLNVQ